MGAHGRHRRDGADLFAAILEAMTALRESALTAERPVEQGGASPEVQQEAQREARREAQREAQREAWMRQTIRAASEEGFKRIAVVCGAWHAPAITVDAGNTPSAKDDAELLKGLPKIKTQATWTPWTYGRLSYHSGYGAGVESPGWYHHLWTARDAVPIRWMARVARLLRRTFSTFTSPERRQIGERARRGMTGASPAPIDAQPRAEDFDQARAEAVLPLIAKLLGVETV